MPDTTVLQFYRRERSDAVLYVRIGAFPTFSLIIRSSETAEAAFPHAMEVVYSELHRS